MTLPSTPSSLDSQASDGTISASDAADEITTWPTEDVVGSPKQMEFDILFAALPDVALRDQRDALERPLVALSKNIRTEPITYTFGELWVRILPNPQYGQPTIWDYDIIMYLLGQINAQFARGRDGRPVPTLTTISTGPRTYTKRPGWEWENPGITVNPRALLTAIGRGTSGKDFAELRAAIGRLQTCFIETNIWHAKRLKKFARFSLIHQFEESTPQDRDSGGMRFVLPTWMIKSVASRKGIYQIDRRYFDLSGGYERFLYRVARKIAGRQLVPTTIGMKTLHERSGSPMAMKDFVKYVRKAIDRGRIPEYDFRIFFRGHDEIVEMTWRHGLTAGSETTQADDPDSSDGPADLAE